MTLSPETEQKLRVQAGLMRSKMNLDTTSPNIEEFYVKELRAAADVAVEGERKSCRESFARMGDANRYLAKELAERDAELAALRKHEPTTAEEWDKVLSAYYQHDDKNDGMAAIDKLRERPLPQKTTDTSLQEADAVYEAWRSAYAGSGSDWTSGVTAMAAAIDKLRERPLPTSGGGMTMDKAVELWFAMNAAADMEHRRDLVNRVVQQELATERERHAAELRKCETDYERALLETVDQQSQRQAKELQEAVAAAYDHCQTLSQDELYKHVAKQDFHGAAGCRSCVDAIKRAAERAAKPQEPSTPQVSESSTLPRWCPECKCTPPAHDSDCSAKPQEGANATQIGGQHWTKLKIRTWDYITANGLGYLEGNVVKYVTRHKDKNGAEDLKKARHYLDKLIETAEPTASQ